MALLQSSASSFISHFPASPVNSVRLSPPFGNRYGGLSVKAEAAAGIVLVDKSEADKVNRLKTSYFEKIVPLLKEEFSYTNIHQVPKVDKIVVNCGIGDAAQNNKGLDAAINDMALITGQRPVKTKAKNPIATFKIRENQTLGIAVTLRGNEQSVFPELSYDALGKPRGMDVCISTTAPTDKEAYKLLALMGMPFREGSGPSAVVRRKKLKSHHFNTKTKQKARR
ncbi:Ribosomal protein L5 [Cynara cardunculus var. scolymus]|uniref:Ribosomal protein L5 n=1 Tax=Cynara cardunculus var. scolymus TaxID=59895 RepID=A0A103XE60_CYNCS|nr:Ribosomal protein L5 [Cynara cardunculus var. scolymus]